MFRLQVLGGFALVGPSGVAIPPLPQRRAEAALAVLAVCGDLGCTRERLMALLWPERDPSHSRHSLRDALHTVRQALGPDAVLAGGDRLHLDPNVVASDVQAFVQAWTSDRHADAVRAYGGPLLDGFHLDDALEFQHWMEGERSRLAREYAESLERLAATAEHAGAWDEAAGWWARAVEHDRANSRVALRHLQALAASGDRANALKAAEAHARRLHEELDLEPDPEFLAGVKRVRSGELPADRESVARKRSAADRPATGLAESAAGHAPLPGPPGAAARLPRWVPWTGAAGAVLILALAATLLLRSRQLLVTASEIVQVTNDPGVEFQPAISPDGNEVAYAAGPIQAPRLMVKSTGNVAGSAAVRLGDTSLIGAYPSWTPDGQQIRYAAAKENLLGARLTWCQTGRLGGAVRLASFPHHGRPNEGNPAQFSPDGKRVAFVRYDTVFTATVGDTGERRIAILAGSILHSLAWSPDARWIAFVAGNLEWTKSANTAASSIWIVSADGGAPRPVATGDHLNVSPAWLDAGHLLFVSNRDGARAVYVADVDARGARGEARPVPGITDPHSISYSIATRKLAWAKFTLRQNIWAYPLGRSRPVSISNGQPVTTGNRLIEMHDVSPDGRSIAFDDTRRGNADIYTMSLFGGEATPLTDAPGDEFNPRWSPDGAEIAFQNGASRSDRTDVLVIPASGGVPVTVVERAWDESWAASGLSLAACLGATVWCRLAVTSRDSLGARWRRPSLVAHQGCALVESAPDGGSIACSDSGGVLQLIDPRTGGLLRGDLAAPNGLWVRYQALRYSPDGRTIYVAGTHRDGRRGVWAIPVDGSPARLVVAYDDPALVNDHGRLSVGRDRLYLTIAEYESDIWVAKLKY